MRTQYPATVTEGETLAKKAMEKVLDTAKKDKKEAKTIKLKCIAKSSVKGLKVAGSIAKIVVSGGTNIAAWGGLIKNVASLAKTIHGYCKDLEKRWEDLRQAIETLSNARLDLKNAREAVESSDTTTKDKLKQAYTIAKNAYGNPQKKALEKCKTYKEKVTLVQSNAHTLAGKLDQLLKKDQTGLGGKKVQKLAKQISAIIENVIDLDKKAGAGKQLAEAAEKHFQEVTEELKDLQKLITGLDLVDKALKAKKIATKILSGAQTLLTIIG